MTPEAHTHFEDFEDFDESWKNWIDHPPVDWAPPADVHIHSWTTDKMADEGWVVRHDTWMEGANLHIHTRFVVLAAVPTFKRVGPPWKRRTKLVRYHWLSKQGVVGSVMPFAAVVGLVGEMAAGWRKKARRNGKGRRKPDAQ